MMKTGHVPWWTHERLKHLLTTIISDQRHWLFCQFHTSGWFYRLRLACFVWQRHYPTVFDKQLTALSRRTDQFWSTWVESWRYFVSATFKSPVIRQTNNGYSFLGIHVKRVHPNLFRWNVQRVYAPAHRSSHVSAPTEHWRCSASMTSTPPFCVLRHGEHRDPPQRRANELGSKSKNTRT